MRRVLITGGAGFIGSHLADVLLTQGSHVRILDSLTEQVHPDGEAPAYLDAQVEIVRGDVRDPDAVRRAVEGVDAVVHLAALVGVGQSMYRIADYTAVNDLGTAVLLEALAQHPVSRLVVASSMSVYGEGLCEDEAGGEAEPDERPIEQLRRGIWEPLGRDGSALRPIATHERKRPALSSMYALNKFYQERACLLFGRAYNVPAVALRFFNVFGPRQALSNPYTGVIAIFASRLVNGRPPLIFEDGQQRRDFVHVRDAARACVQALERPEAAGRVFNVGTGVPRTIESVASTLARVLGRPEIAPEISGRYRAGDIRHCVADVTLARDILGFETVEDFDGSLVELTDWLMGEIAIDRVDDARDELVRRGLVA